MKSPAMEYSERMEARLVKERLIQSCAPEMLAFLKKLDPCDEIDWEGLDLLINKAEGK